MRLKDEDIRARLSELRGWRYENRDYDTMRPYVRYGYEHTSRGHD